MPKAPDTSVSISYGGFPVYDPRQLYAEYQRQLAENPNTWPGISLEFWGLANSYRCPRGSYAGRAWLLMLRRDINFIDINSPQIFEIVSSEGRFTTKLMLLQARCMTPGAPGDPYGVYLVELADRRYLVEHVNNTNATGLHPCANLRLPVPYSLDTDGSDPTNEFYSTSLTSSTTLRTWTKLIEDMWNNNLSAATRIGSAYPGLPYTPVGHPENLNLETSFDRWADLHYALSLLHCDTVYNPWDSDSGDTGAAFGSPFSKWVGTGKTEIVRLGTVQEELTTVIDDARKAGTLLFEYDTIESDTAKYRAFYITMFPLDYYRQPHDHPLTNRTLGVLGNGTNKFWSKIVSAATLDPSLSGNVIGNAMVYEPRPAMMDAIGDDTENPLNETLLDDRADEIGENMHNARKYSQDTFRYMISGHVEIRPGSQVKAVIWGDIGNGYMTEILSFRGPAGQVLGFNQGSASSPAPLVNWDFKNPHDPVAYAFENSQQSSIRKTLYNNFPETALVSISAAAEPSANGVYTGAIAYTDPGTALLNPGAIGGVYKTGAGMTCWMAIIPGPVRGTANTAGKAYARYYLARLCGVHDEAGDVRPLYIADMGTMGVGAVATATYAASTWTPRLSKNIAQSSGTFTVQHPGNYLAYAHYNTTGTIAGPTYTTAAVGSPLTIQKLTAGQTFVFSTPASTGEFGVVKMFHED